MLARKHRLTGSNDFKKVQNEGKVFQSPNFGMAYLDRKDELPPRFGFVISTKISKDAVDRNTIRRHMSETVRQMTNEVKNGLDVVFLAKMSVITVPAEELVKEVKKAVRQSEIAK